MTALYIHIPFCTAKCSYCGFYSIPVDKFDTSQFIEALLNELHRLLDHDFSTIYMGGGSPTCLPGQQLEKILNKLADFFAPEEFTVEANPSQLSPDLARMLKDHGVNRLSIGVQSFIETELKTLGRSHNTKQVYNSFESARNAGFHNISLDLIFAIPGCTIESWRTSLGAAIELAPEHISTYSLSYEKNTPLKQLLELGKIKPAAEETDRQMYEIAIENLRRAGFEHYEISNFARPNSKCLHNLGCWQNEPYIGIGPAAHSSTVKARWENIPDVKKYTLLVNQGLSPAVNRRTITDRELICETAVLALRTADGINVREFIKKTGQNPLELFDQPIRRLANRGMIKADGKSISLAKTALPIADTVLCEFSDLP